MPSLMEQYSAPEDIEAYHTQMRFYRDYLPPVPVPLREHGPELDDRWCLKHSDPTWRLGLFSGRRCAECEQDEFRAWEGDLRKRLKFSLDMAASGKRFPLRPIEEDHLVILGRLMELHNAPRTLDEATEWIRKYLPKAAYR